MVESNSATLASMWAYDLQADEARIARPELLDLGFDSRTSEYGVDRDFVACLEDAPLADNPAMPTGVAPIFMPGHSLMGSVATLESSSVTCPENPGSIQPAVE